MAFICGRCRLEKTKKPCKTIEQARAHYTKSHAKAARKG